MQPKPDAIALFGTDEPAPPPVLLRAGSLTAELEAGNLRHIKVGPIEVLRAISFIVRDRHWGTYGPVISDLVAEQSEAAFSVRYRAEVTDGTQFFRYRATIEGSPDRVSFAAEGEATTVFETCRTGFVVLHPVSGVAGEPVTIEHVDGRTVAGRFPDLIDPIQPLMDLRALTHNAAPGLSVTCRMEGDTFEMEDQRNWCDASYKTYVRPLSRPWPYRLGAGEGLSQAVTLEVTGRAPASAGFGGAVNIALQAPIGTAPRLGLGLDPSEFEPTRRVLPQLRALAPAILSCHFDPRRGHDRATLETAVAIARDLGAEPWLEAVIADVEGFEAEIEALGSTVQAIGSPFRAVLLSPAADLKSTTPGQPWPPAPPPDAFLAAARRSFPDAKLGGGMISSFTELNRKRPPLDHLDFVGFTTMGLIHASDDVSVMEGLQALPSIARSAKAIAGELPIVVGPSAIGLRLNPYGAAPIPNPANRRQAMALNDPRHRALLGAAWAVGYYAHLASAGVEAVLLGSTTGPFGAVHTRQTWPTPGYADEGQPYPNSHALRVLSAFGGHRMLAVTISAPDRVQAVAVDGADGRELIVTNLTPESLDIRFDEPARCVFLMEGLSPLDQDRMPGAPSARLLLPSYGLAHVRI